MSPRPLAVLTIKYFIQKRIGLVLALLSLNVLGVILCRSQQVIANGELPSIVSVDKGIAQGTVLGPILLIFYINYIFKCAMYVKMSLFANDCVMYLSGSNWSVIQRRMQRDLDTVVKWTFGNDLRLNHSKTKAIMFRTRGQLSHLVDPVVFSIQEKRIGFEASHSYLGITLDSAMSLIPLIKNVKKRVSNKIFLLRKIRKYLALNVAVLVYKQTILPIIDYVTLLLISCTKDELQKLQNDTLRICNNCLIEFLWKLQAKCKIISIEQHMRKQLLWLMYLLSRDRNFIQVPGRFTCIADKIGFTVPCKISPVFERSPYYINHMWGRNCGITCLKISRVFFVCLRLRRKYM